jgi:hypothetical protein
MGQQAHLCDPQLAGRQAPPSENELPVPLESTDDPASPGEPPESVVPLEEAGEPLEGGLEAPASRTGGRPEPVDVFSPACAPLRLSPAFPEFELASLLTGGKAVDDALPHAQPTDATIAHGACER